MSNVQHLVRIRTLIAGLYPPVCLLCGRAVEHSKSIETDIRDICAGCYADLPFNKTACQRCGLPLAGNRDSNEAMICGQCLRKTPAFDRTITPFLYQPPVDYLIKALKFQHRLAMAPLLAGLLADAVDMNDLPEIIIPVPLHPRRLRERGFNQALELAEPLARRWRLPVATNIVKRIRHTLPQSELSFTARASNLRDAFMVSGALNYRHVAIVDDVVTTANTVNEVARLLRTAGVERIQVWACARTSN